MTLKRASHAAFLRHLYHKILVGDEGTLSGHEWTCLSDQPDEATSQSVKNHSTCLTNGLGGFCMQPCGKGKVSCKTSSLEQTLRPLAT